MKNAILLFGPTASGKTELAIRLAQRFNGEIINADSRQFYQNMPIITAMPSPDEFERAPHHLFEILAVDADFSVADFLKLAEKKSEEIVSRGKLPIFVGGTGLYLKALEFGLSPIPSVDKKLVIELSQQNTVSLYNQLQNLDPNIAKTLESSDTQRIIRALSVVKQTGISLAKWQAKQNQGQLKFNFIHLAINPDRETLYNRINLRANKMLNNGLIEELTWLNTKYKDTKLNSLSSIGFDIFQDYFNGKIDVNTAVNRFAQKQRNYAKRQLTWLNNQYPTDYVYDNFENTSNFLENYLT